MLVHLKNHWNYTVEKPWSSNSKLNKPKKKERKIIVCKTFEDGRFHTGSGVWCHYCRKPILLCWERGQKLELELHYENCIRIPRTWCNRQSNAQGLNIVRITARTMVKVIKLQNFPTNRAARRSENGHKCNHRNRQWITFATDCLNWGRAGQHSPSGTQSLHSNFLSVGNQVSPRLATKSNHISHAHLYQLRVGNAQICNPSPAVFSQESIKIIYDQLLNEPGLLSCPNIPMAEKINNTRFLGLSNERKFFFETILLIRHNGVHGRLLWLHFTRSACFWDPKSEVEV